MSIFKSNVFIITIEVFLIAVIVFVLFRYHNLVNQIDFLSHSRRTYVLEIQEKDVVVNNADAMLELANDFQVKETEQPVVASEEKIKLSILITDLGLDHELLDWVLHNFGKEVLIGLSPYISPDSREFISKIENDIYVSIPIKTKKSNESGGELRIVDNEYEENVKKIINILSVSDKIKGIYLKDIKNISEDKKTLDYILTTAYDNHLSVITEKTDLFHSDDRGNLSNKLSRAHVADFSIFDDENIFNLQNTLKSLEDNHEKYKNGIVVVVSNLSSILREIKIWLEKQGKFSLTKNLTNVVDHKHDTHKIEN